MLEQASCCGSVLVNVDLLNMPDKIVLNIGSKLKRSVCETKKDQMGEMFAGRALFLSQA
jgi:hypothetical protein